MVKYTDTWTFYTNRVSFLNNGTEVSEYTDSPSLYEEMVSKAPYQFSNFVNEVIEPTEEQIARLEDINKLKLEYPSSYMHIFQEFVRDGYLGPTDDPLLTKLYKKNQKVAQQQLIEEISKHLSNIKTEKEYGGVEYNGHKIATDLESQSKISSTLLGFMSGMITEVNFKFKDGFEMLDKEKFIKLAQFVMVHVQICFTAESLCKAELPSKTTEELDKIDELHEIQEWYNNKYDELLKLMLQPKTEVKEEKKK